MSEKMVRFIFSDHEKNVLLKLVVQHYHILKCKENRTEVIKGKCMAWIDITEKFNSTLGVRQCDAKKLKKCWQNIKSRNQHEFRLGNLVTDEQMVEEGVKSNGVAATLPNTSDISDESQNEPDQGIPCGTSGEPSIEAGSIVPINPRKRRYQNPELELEMKIQEHEAKLSKLQHEKLCFENEHWARMEQIATQTYYYKEKIKLLKLSQE